MIEIASMFLGIFLGMIMGLLPGIGPATLMLLLYPLLLNPVIDIWILMCIYIGIVNSGQYYGSVSASVFGVMGESSSLPAVKNGYPLTLKGRGGEVLGSASTSSFIAVVLSMLATSFIVVYTPESLLFMLKGKVVFFMLLATSAALILNSGKILLSTVMMLLGIIISLVGWDDFFETSILTFGNSQLEGGVPMFPLFSGLLLVPIALESIAQRDNAIGQTVYVSIIDRLKYIQKYLLHPSILRGTVIGFVCGFIPGSGYTISSNLADTIEEKYSKHTDDDTQKLRRLMSAEAANNAGSISVLIPLLMFGLPIVFSEAVFMGVAEIKGFSYSYSYEWFIENWPKMVAILATINIINWLLAGVFFDIVLGVYKHCKNWIYHFLIGISICIMIYMGYTESRILMSMIVFAIALIIGIYVKHTGAKFVFVYAYFVSELIVDEAYRILF